MPYKSEKIRIAGTQYDRRIKLTPALNRISIEMCQYFENYNLLLNTKFTVWDLVI